MEIIWQFIWYFTFFRVADHNKYSPKRVCLFLTNQYLFHSQPQPIRACVWLGARVSSANQQLAIKLLLLQQSDWQVKHQSEHSLLQSRLKHTFKINISYTILSYLDFKSISNWKFYLGRRGCYKFDAKNHDLLTQKLTIEGVKIVTSSF